MGWIRRKHADRRAAPSIPPSKPLARSEDLVVEELGDELLVYDLTTDQAHALGPAAARVWRACDGKTDAVAFSVELGLDGETVTRALEELRECGLLDDGSKLAPGISRRDLSLRVAKVGGAVAASPLIASLAVPAPAEAQSPSIETCTVATACGSPCTGIAGCGCCQLTGPNRPEQCPGGTTGTGNCCLPPGVCLARGGAPGEDPPLT